MDEENLVMDYQMEGILTEFTDEDLESEFEDSESRMQRLL